MGESIATLPGAFTTTAPCLGYKLSYPSALGPGRVLKHDETLVNAVSGERLPSGWLGKRKLDLSRPSRSGIGAEAEPVFVLLYLFRQCAP